EQPPDSDIVVASQFGHWDVDQLTVVPPEGPTASSRGSASTDTSGTSGGGAGAGGQGSSAGGPGRAGGRPGGRPPRRRPTVVVCGLGPAGPDLVTGAVHAAVARIPHRYLRTTRHPAAPVVGEAVGFDDRYERAERLADVYAGIVEDLGAAAEGPRGGADPGP